MCRVLLTHEIMCRWVFICLVFLLRVQGTYSYYCNTVLRESWSGKTSRFDKLSPAEYLLLLSLISLILLSNIGTLAPSLHPMEDNFGRMQQILVKIFRFKVEDCLKWILAVDQTPSSSLSLQSTSKLKFFTLTRPHILSEARVYKKGAKIWKLFYLNFYLFNHCDMQRIKKLKI